MSTAASTARGGEQFEAFQKGLRDGGYAEGNNLQIEYRWADDDYARLDAMADELVSLGVSVIVAAGGHVSALAAHRATKQIPIIFTTVTDPVSDGLVVSLNRPGGNATGTAGLTSELDAKRLELLHEAKPSASLIGVLANPNRPGLDKQLRDLLTAAGRLGVKLEIEKVATDTEIDTAFKNFAAKGVGALVVTADPLFNNRRKQVIAHTARQSLPAIFQWREFVTDGGLMSYGPSLTEAYEKAGTNTALVLKGSKPAEIPVVQPTRFLLVINRKIAKELNLTISPTLLTFANEVIE